MEPERCEIRYDAGTLLMTGATGRLVDQLFAEGPWTWDARVSAWRCRALEYARVRTVLAEKLADGLDDAVLQSPAWECPARDLPALRPEQREALTAWEWGGRRGQIVMPTGTGKTVVALHAIAGAKQRALVVVPVRDLMYQWHRRILDGLGFDAGLIGNQHFQVRPISVATYDSAYLHMDKLGDRFGLIVFDEMHHLPGTSRREAALLSAAPMRLGLSATPERADGRHCDLDWLVGPVSYRQEIPQARGRTLADYEVVRIPVALSDDEQKRYEDAGRRIREYMIEQREEQPGFAWADVAAGMARDPEARYAMKAFHLRRSIEDRAAEKLRVLEDLFRLHVGERVMVFTGSNVMAMEISARFLVPTILSHTGKKERLEVLQGFADGRFPVLVANRVLDEGVDVPAAKVAVVIGGMGSTRQAKQRLGRVLRRSGNVRAVLYEIVCEDTKEVQRSRQRRRNDAYQGTRHRRV